MFEWLKNNWFELLILVLIYPGYIGIKKAIENSISELPQRLHEIKIEEIRNKNSNIMQDKEHQTTRELQIDNYYRSISGKKIEALFSNWMDMIANTEKVENLKAPVLNKMIKELMMYGSTRTVYIGSLFQQYNYKRPPASDEFNAFELLYLGASLVASMKQDFTGYEVDPEVLLKMKINDIDSKENKEKFKIAKENANKIIEDGFM
ncbi:hypothetical protein [Vagococcus lutrae]|uniref:hypothetical protein n=1 Tax=Vagococcus lutrae TaxID=81947 RepID=UPI0014442A9D|nr:hypothetical protein [Vagococcus lutrae]NKZ27357.1 hypothetical protein [Vagococcus lutrae]